MIPCDVTCFEQTCRNLKHVFLMELLPQYIINNHDPVHKYILKVIKQTLEKRLKYI